MRGLAPQLLEERARALADAVCEEWRAVGPQARLNDLPLARMAAAATESGSNRTHVENSLLSYADTDLVCYWSSDAEPATLRARQAAAWQPMLDWARTALGVELQVASGIVPISQSAAAKEKLRTAICSLSLSDLIGLRVASAAVGSLVIGLGIVHGAWGAEQAHTAATVDERFQMERWGVDSEAEEAIEARRKDLEAAVRFLQLSRAPEQRP